MVFVKRFGQKVGAALLLVALCAPAAALATHSESEGGPRESATGSAKNVLFEVGGPVQLAVSAHGSGADVTGHVRGRGDFGGEFRVAGHVTCLWVEGNRASIKYRFDKAEGSLAEFEGGGVQVFVEDNRALGQPDANSTDLPERPGVFDALGRHKQCDDPASRPYNPVDSGNYVVHDALP